MRGLSLLVFLSLVLPAATVRADPLQEQPTLPQDPYELGAGSVPPTPEMWFYLQQQRRYDDPKLAVRRNAERRASERRDRIAAMKWFGQSNQRPRANPTPWFGDYSPMWAAGLWEPYRWVGARMPSLFLVTDRYVNTQGH